MTLPVDTLFSEIRSLIEQTRQQAYTTVNAELTMLYWRIGRRISNEILEGNRADYGKQIVATLSRQLYYEYGSGYSEKNLRRMIQFASAFPEESIVATLSRDLSWSHFRELIPITDSLQRDFYSEMCRIERWSVRRLRDRIGSLLYERTALSRKPEELVRDELDTLRKENRLTPDLVFRDPYILDFLGLRDRFLERDLEDAILRELETFLLELGSGFSFIARQHRITVDDDDYYLDLLFYHRRLHRLVAIDLKLSSFKPADKGQMELYLRWLDRYERQPTEETPIGLILCAGKKQETVELLSLGETGIRVAEYLTELPPRETLKARLHQAIASARARLLPSNTLDDD